MNKVALFLLITIFSYNIKAYESPSREAVIEYLEITRSIEALEGYSKSYIKVVQSGYPELDKEFYLDPKFVAILKEYERKMTEKFISIIISNLSKAELAEFTKFLKSDLGKKYIDLTTKMEPQFLEAATTTNIWLNKALGDFLYEYGIRCKKC